MWARLAGIRHLPRALSSESSPLLVRNPDLIVLCAADSKGISDQPTGTLVSDIFVTKESKGGDPTCTIDFVEMKKAGKTKVTIVKVTRGSSLSTYAFPSP